MFDTQDAARYLSQVMLQDITGTPRHWIDDSDYAFPSTDLADGELSTDGKWLAEVRGYGASSAIIWYQVSGNARTGLPPAVPKYTCLTGGEAEYASPTWSPNSTALAWTGKTGIRLTRQQPAGETVGDSPQPHPGWSSHSTSANWMSSAAASPVRAVSPVM